jgi:hypothetical protein
MAEILVKNLKTVAKGFYLTFCEKSNKICQIHRLSGRFCWQKAFYSFFYQKRASIVLKNQISARIHRETVSHLAEDIKSFRRKFHTFSIFGGGKAPPSLARRESGLWAMWSMHPDLHSKLRDGNRSIHFSDNRRGGHHCKIACTTRYLNDGCWKDAREKFC